MITDLFYFVFERERYRASEKHCRVLANSPIILRIDDNLFTKFSRKQTRTWVFISFGVQEIDVL